MTAQKERPTYKNTTGLLLSGGRGRRMGYTQKHTLMLGNKQFLTLGLEALGGFSRRAISTKIDTISATEGVDIYIDMLDIGPLGGIYTALKQCDTPYLFVLSCDTPHINPDFVDFMLSQMDTTYLGLYPVVRDKINVLSGIYHRELLPYIEDAIGIGRYSVTKAIEPANLQYIDVTGTAYEKMLFNVNTPADYQKMEHITTENTSARTHIFDKIL